MKNNNKNNNIIDKHKVVGQLFSALQTLLMGGAPRDKREDKSEEHSEDEDELGLNYVVAESYMLSYFILLQTVFFRLTLKLKVWVKVFRRDIPSTELYVVARLLKLE